MHTRRQFMKQVALAAGAGAALPLTESCSQLSGELMGGRGADRPNIILILTDDQGYGDLSLTGNPHLKTPHIDSLARDGLFFTQFLVCPCCSPTRASILTGRYNYRTRVCDTYCGRSMMDPAEVTIAEALRPAGYRTGIFGKWHLGDHWPMRAMDQGFEETLVHRGGGMRQPSDEPGTSYFEPILYRNGRQEQFHRYCMDVYTDAAIDFIERHRREPFFVYLPTNTPHMPLEVPESYAAPFRAMGLEDNVARTYGMVANIDENVGRLLGRLRDLNLEANTIVIFLSDNGGVMENGNRRYNDDLRGQKTDVFEGGILSPCVMRWPRRIAPGSRIARMAAHIDLMPTLLEACGAAPPAGVRLDGRSLMPLIDRRGEPWPERTLFFQWHRGTAPELYRNAAARTEQWKLVGGAQLYDLKADPGEQHDVAAAHSDVVARLRAEYEAWFRDVCSTRGFEPPRITLGAPQEISLTLTRQDWLGTIGWSDNEVGHWSVRVAAAGRYSVTLRFPASLSQAGQAHFRLAGVARDCPMPRGTTECLFDSVELPAGDGKLEAWFSAGDARTGVMFVDVQRL